MKGIEKVKIKGKNEEMIIDDCEKFLGKKESEIKKIDIVKMEGNKSEIMGRMKVEEI